MTEHVLLYMYVCIYKFNIQLYTNQITDEGTVHNTICKDLNVTYTCTSSFIQY